MKSKVIICLLALMAGIVTSCKISESQAKVIAQNAGLAAAVTWIAYDNPDTNAMALVSMALDIVGKNVVDVSNGHTYTEVLFPKIQLFAKSEAVPAQYKPLVVAGSMAALNGIDLLFAMNPEWNANSSLAYGVVNSFINGAKNGLSLAEKDPVIVQARIFGAKRAKMWK